MKQLKIALFTLILFSIIFIVGCNNNQQNLATTQTSSIQATSITTSVSTTNPTTSIPSEYFSCNQDSDCIQVNVGCCGCSSGGRTTAINRNYQDEWNNLLNECGTGYSCAAVISQHVSCYSDVKCTNNKCELAPSIEKFCNPIGEYEIDSCRKYTSQAQQELAAKQYGLSCNEVIDLCG